MWWIRLLLKQHRTSPLNCGVSYRYKKKLLPDDAGMISVCWGGCMPTIQPH
jgi:hypothetical protein